MKQGWKVKIFDWGRFALDGGAMFGVVPKTLWSRVAAADELNRIPLGLRSLYLEQGEKKVLVELGMGNDWEEKFRKIYALESSPLEEILKSKLSLSPSEITHIVLTHLHFDHCGYLSQKIGSSWQSAFPNAEIFVTEENFKNAKDPSSRESASYLPHFWQDPYKRGQFHLVSCQRLEFREIMPGIAMRRVDGHTLGQAMIYVNGVEQNYLFPGDLCPTENHVKENYVMGYDMYPALGVLEKKQVFGEEETRSRELVFVHSTAQK